VSLKRFFNRKLLRRVLLAIPVILLGIQFVPIDRTNPAVGSEVPAPGDVRAVLRRACYDCHSNETVWPWYSRVAPVSWLVASDVHEARKHLNFSIWGEYSERRQRKKLEECSEQIDEGEMPLWIYLVVHRDASLSPQEKTLLQEWSRRALEGFDTLPPAPETP
jgi:hypothetical protein